MFKDFLSVIKEVEVFGFTDPELAFDHFAMNKDNYLLVVSDFRMPRMNGIELFTKMKKTNPNVKTILISAFEMSDEIFQGCNSIDKKLQKPIRLTDLLSEINDLITKSVPSQL
jgi:YesN/AraC family two-component response regulator